MTPSPSIIATSVVVGAVDEITSSSSPSPSSSSDEGESSTIAMALTSSSSKRRHHRHDGIASAVGQADVDDDQREMAPIIVAPSSTSPSTPSSIKKRIRLLYFLFRFSTGIPNPFMTLYMKHVGLDPERIGTLQAIRPMVTMMSAPLWGGLADGTGRKKMVLMVSGD